ncbi:MAG: hypothetical protein FE834_08025 [Gammaproteobacteria bacterium]|uniref:Uncharacterized protein n=1 Tax=hydrothermal vent metagenome TaxID=652676 RepID=A0A1W1E523_9ZZZZ|nr:hypothetical protein [Gammaproteobacteria bacterium]
MKFINFKLPILIPVSVLVFSLNVLSADICTPNQNFEDEISLQEEANQQYQVARSDDVYPEANMQYADVVNNNISTLKTNSKLNIAELTEETLDETESVVEAGSSIGSIVGATIGAIGIVVTIGITIWQVVTVFENPNSSDIDKVHAFLGWVPLVGTILGIFSFSSDRDALNKRLKAKFDAISYADHYEFKAEKETQEALLARVRVSLESATNKNAALVQKIMIGINEKLSKHYQSKYLNNVELLQTYTKQLFATKWIKTSPKFQHLIDFIDQSNKAGEIIGTVDQDKQWHHLTDNGRADSTRVLGLSKITHTNTSGDETTLNTNMSVIKSTELDNTWLIGGVPNSNGYYLVVALRDALGQDKGVEYKAYSIVRPDNLGSLVSELATTENFITAGWVVTSDYVAKNLSVGQTVSVSIPNIISGRTVRYCGISQQGGNFLMDKTKVKIGQCLDNIFQDYKDYFSAYDLDSTIQINTRGSANVETTFDQFLSAYGQTYNHLLAQTKISTINKFYKAKEPVNAKSCKTYSDGAKKFLTHVDKIMDVAGEKTFRKHHNIDIYGRNLSSKCWGKSCKVYGSFWKGSHCKEYYPEPYYMNHQCGFITYTPKRDTELDLALNAIRQQVEDEEQNCLEKKDYAPIIFARKLTAQGNFYLDRSDFRALFEEVFEGVRVVLIKRFIKDAKINKMSKIKN